MGCLLELIFEIVFEAIIEGVLWLYMKLMTLLVPEHQFDINLRKKIKKGVTVFAAALILCAFIGFFLFLQPPSVTKTVGMYMLFIPLGIMGVQIIAGIIYRIIRFIKKRH